MIRQAYKDWFLQRLTNLTSTGISGATHIALASAVGENKFQEIQPYGTHEEPSGYKRYPLAGNITLKDNVVTNTNTLYFDEATDDWTTAANYFVLVTQSTGGSVVAWGEIVDQYGNPKPINVKKEQLPIIRAGQLKISLSEVERTKYSVNFNQDGGTGAENMQGLYCIPGGVESKKTGYVFDNWYLDSDKTVVAVPGTELVADTTLFAKWLEACYVTFKDGESTLYTQPVGKGRTAHNYTPSKDGYNFIGWYTTVTCDEGTEFNFSTIIEDNITLYALFEKITE